MTRLVLFAVCDSTSVDMNRNRISLFDVLESITAPSFPYLQKRLAVVAISVRDSSQGTVRFPRTLLVELSGEEMLRSELSFNYEEDKVARSIVEFGSFAIPAPGELKFSLLDQGKEEATWCISVEQVGPIQAHIAGATDRKTAQSASQETKRPKQTT